MEFTDLNRRATRRTVLRVLAVGGVASVMAACATPTPSSPTAAPGQPTSASQAGPGPTGAPVASQPHSGGILRQGNLGDLPTTDGNFLNGQSTIYPVWDRLVELDSKLNPKGILVESFDVDDKYTRIAMHLRQGVQFHTGRELTAEDVMWNIKRVSSDPKLAGGGFYNWMSQTLTGMETPDKYTIVLHAERSWPAVFDVLSLLNIIDPVTLQDQGPSKPIGTGPFTFAEYIQGDHFTLKKNPNYWQSGKPYLDGVEIKIFADPQSMVTQLEAGVIDVALMPPFRDAARLQKDPRFNVLVNELSGSINLLWTQNKDGAGPTTNKLFRQALNYAMDRQRWSDSVLFGFGKPTSLPITATNPAYDPAKDATFTFDLDKAKSLLEQSGVGTPPIEAIWSAPVTDNATVLQIYQQDLAKIGLQMTLRPLEPNTFVDQTYGAKFANMAAGVSVYGNVRPSMFAGNVYYSPYTNWGNFKSDTLVQLTDGLLHETDPVKQKQVYADWVTYIQDQAFAMPWALGPRLAIQSAKVNGLRWNLLDYMMTNDVWLS